MSGRNTAPARWTCCPMSMRTLRRCWTCTQSTTSRYAPYPRGNTNLRHSSTLTGSTILHYASC
eukprot:364988-Chlamydomonas_euryale.AAC.17